MTEGHIYIYGVITPFQGSDTDYWGEVNLKQVIRQMQSFSNVDKYVVHIRSEGGDVDEGFAIHDALINSGKEIQTIGEGIVASIATVIFCAGSTRSMSANAEFMIHNPYMWSGGTAEELKKDSERLEMIENKIIDFYTEKTGSDRELIASMMKEETFLSSEKALEMGFATEILNQVKAVALINKSNKMKAEESKTIMAKLDQMIESIKNLVTGKSNIEDFTIATGDGTILDFGKQITEKTDVVVGLTATVDGKAAEGEFLMPSGETYVFLSGKLEDIKAPEKSEEVKSLENKVASLNDELESQKAENTRLTGENTSMKAELEKVQEEIVKIKAEIKSTVDDPKKPIRRDGGTPENRFENFKINN